MAKIKKAVKKATRAKKAATAKSTSKPAASKKTTRSASAKRAPVTKKAVAKKVARPEKKSAKPRASTARPKVVREAAAASVDAAPTRKVSSGLSARDLEMFRELLMDKRREILGDMSTMRDEASSSNGGDLSSMPLHMADLGTDNFERELTLGLMQGERALAREIDAALTRIEKGEFGICAATGKPIGKARLKAQPWAKYCYEYMLQQERGRRFGY